VAIGSDCAPFGIRRDDELRRLALLLEKLFGAVFDFGGCYVLDLGAEEPGVAGGVFYGARSP
jgi:hypothetical protein